MKTFIYAILIILCATFTYAQVSGPTGLTASGVKTSATTIVTGVGKLGSAVAITDGTNNATLTCYDNTSAAGTQLFPALVVLGASRFGGVDFCTPVRFKTGCHCTISGTGASFEVYTDK
jgi:hypothetical protein